MPSPVTFWAPCDVARAMVVVCIVALGGCARRESVQLGPGTPPIATDSIHPISAPPRPSAADCMEAWRQGSHWYDAYARYDVEDVSNFGMAALYLDVAAQACQSLEYGDDSLFSLANALFFLGDYQRAATVYDQLVLSYPTSDYNLGNFVREEAVFLHSCTSDLPSLDAYRRATLYELRGLISDALFHYQRSSASSCHQLHARSRLRVEALRGRR
jgi:tetratricopeptide (TPR) repeat protein